MRVHSAERDRLDSLAPYDVVGAGPLVELDAVTRLAAEALGLAADAVGLPACGARSC